MKTSKISFGLFVLMTIAFVTNISAQKEGDKVPKPPPCTTSANQIYFVASGQSVTEVRPGSNGGNGYQLNILGTDVDKFEVIQEKYMTSLSVIPNYTNSTGAKWQIFFAARQGQRISSIRMRSNCNKGQIKTYQLTESVMLLDQ
jgi:hypothetical protein